MDIVSVAQLLIKDVKAYHAEKNNQYLQNAKKRLSRD
jgi:hypothetical protein